MEVFINLFLDEIDFIEEKYKIKILEIKNIDNGILNSNFYVEAKNKKYILRIYEANRTIDEEKQELIKFIKATGNILDETLAISQRYLEKAVLSIENLENDNVREELVFVMNRLARRKN